jgi:hypothetical protein
VSEKIRGYVFLSAAKYLEEVAGKGKWDQISERFSPQVKQALKETTTTNWCAIDAVAEVYRAIAALSEGNEAQARDALIDCGSQTMYEASNTFFRLIMKVLTPGLFMKKMPDFWKRDCSRGTIQVEMHENMLRNTLSGIGGFDHIAPIALGYVKFALEGMGKTIVKTELYDWSLKTPGPESFSFLVQWRG